MGPRRNGSRLEKICSLTVSSQNIYTGKKQIREGSSKDTLTPPYNHVQVSMPTHFPHACLLTVSKPEQEHPSLAGGTRLLEQE